MGSDIEKPARRLRAIAAVGLLCGLTLLMPVTLSHQPVPPQPQRMASLAGNPFAQNALPATERRWLQGHVDTRLKAGPYVYLRVREPNGDEAWLVSLAATTPQQPRVRALVLGQADHFHSSRLNRDFEPLLFAAVRGDEP